MDPAAALPDVTPEMATSLSQGRLQGEVAMRVQKMAMDSEAQQAAQMLASLGLGANLDRSA